MRNVIERSIGVLKKRFAYLRNAPYHSIETQAKIVIACCALHNFLRDNDPDDMCETDPSVNEEEEAGGHEDANIIIATSQLWTATRDAMAEHMWNEYR